MTTNLNTQDSEKKTTKPFLSHIVSINEYLQQQQSTVSSGSLRIFVWWESGNHSNVNNVTCRKKLYLSKLTQH